MAGIISSGCLAPALTKASKPVAPVRKVSVAHVITQAIDSGLHDSLGAPFRLIDRNNGQLMWYYKNINDYFNQQTFNYISKRPIGQYGSLAELSEAGGFPNSYSSVLQLLYYNINSTDKQRIAKASSDAAACSDSTVAIYEANFGAISTAEIAAAISQYGLWIANKIDFIINIKMSIVWSNRNTGGAPPLSVSQMASATNLESLMPMMPPNGKTTLEHAAKFLRKTTAVAGLFDSAQNAAWTIRQLKNNCQYPNELNGGMRLIDPFTGQISGYQVGYSVNNPLQILQQQIQDTSRNILINIQALDSGGANIDVTVRYTKENIFHKRYQIPDSICVVKDTSISSSCGGAGFFATACIRGFVIIDTQPLAWNDISNTGWLFSYPISQATQNDTFDVTGYKFILPPPYNMKPDNDRDDFAYLSKILVSNTAPELVFGTQAETTKRSTGTFLYSQPSTPLMQSTAYVIGGVFTYPGK